MVTRDEIRHPDRARLYGSSCVDEDVVDDFTQRLEGLRDAVPGGPATSFIGWYGYYDGHPFDEDTYYENGEIPPAAVAIDNVAAVTGPVQLTHGEDDPVVPAEQSVAFAKALEEAGKEVSLNVVPNAANHVFDGYGEGEITPEGATAAEEMVDWYLSLEAAA